MTFATNWESGDKLHWLQRTEFCLFLAQLSSCFPCMMNVYHWWILCYRINNCVGEENQFAFLLLLIYASLLSLNSLLLQIAYFFWLGDCLSCDSVISHSIQNKSLSFGWNVVGQLKYFKHYFMINILNLYSATYMVLLLIIYAQYFWVFVFY